MTRKIDFKKLKFIFVDFDGTLVDSVPFLYDNYSLFLKSYGKEGSLEEFQALMGPTIKEFIPILKQRYNLKTPVDELVEAYVNGLSERYLNEAKLIEGSEQFLEYVKPLGFKLALVTSSPHALIDQSLEKLELKKYFDDFITGEKVQKTKPDPEIYLLTLKSCKARVDEAISIEDSYNGIISSLRANIPTVAIKNAHLLQVPDQAILVNGWQDLLNLFRQAYEK